jgi:hypothetical protein
MEILIFFAIAFLIITVGFITQAKRRRKLASMTVVNAATEYPNNHHVLGVGYYHAASRMWFSHPWNEYREDRGYYWNGAWNPLADQRMVARSTPLPDEVMRVNQEWRKVDPERARRFWSLVEHEGFGTAIRRSEGS